MAQRARSVFGEVARRFIHQRAAVVALILLCVITAITLLAPYLGLPDPDVGNLSKAFEGSAPGHPLGFDAQGRDVLSRLVFGARATLSISILAVLLGMVFGVVLGVVSGFFGRATDGTIQRVNDILLVFNPILLGLFLVGFLGPGALNLVIAVGIGMIPIFVRLTRGIALQTRSTLYVEAARTFGARPLWILRRHMIGDVLAPSIAMATLGMGISILSAAGLGFLGLGVQSPTPEWGTMMGDGRNYLFSDPWLVTLPGLAIIVVVVAFNLLGDGLQVALSGESPRRRRLPAVVTRGRAPSAIAPGTGSRPGGVVEVEDGGEDADPGRGGDPCVLHVTDLHTQFGSGDGTVFAVQGVSFDVHAGETVGLVGESGCGKTTTMRSVLGLIEGAAGRVTRGTALFEGVDTLRLGAKDRRRLLGGAVALIPQDPMSALNPVMRIGVQLDEAIRNHQPAVRRAERRDRILEALALVGLDRGVQLLRQYPHELSGGMLQRVMIAMAILNKPRLIVADEPTTALDVTVQAHVLDTLAAAQKASGAAVVLITHDLGVIAERTSRVLVMYAGKVVESGPTRDVLTRPYHPYTRALLASSPEMDIKRHRLTAIQGQPPRLSREWVGCAFAPRCAAVLRSGVCQAEVPELVAIDHDRKVACHAVALAVAQGHDPDALTRGSRRQ